MLKPNFTIKKNSTLGLDIGSRTIKAVKLIQKDGQKLKLDFSGMYSIESQENYLDGFKDFLSKNKLLGLKTAACIEDSSLKIRKVDLPKMPEADLKEAVRWKMRDVVEGSIDEYTVRSSKLSDEQTDSKNIELVGYAVRKEAVKKLLNNLQKVGLKPEYIEPSVISLAAAIEPVYPSDDQWIASIDLGASKSLMVITGHTKFYFSRPLPGIKMAKNEEEQSSYNQRLAAEIQNTIDTFSITFRVERIKRILLSGGGANIPGLSEYLNKNLAIQTDVFNSFQAIEINSEQETELRESTHLYSQAVSLAQIRL